MSDFKKQIIKDTTTETTIKFVGVIDAGGQPFTDKANTTLVMSDLKGAYDTNNQLRSVTGGAAQPFYNSWIRSVNWSLATQPANSNIQLVWRGSVANSVAVNMAYGPGQFNFEDSAAVISYDGQGNGANSGELFIAANGIVQGAYTVIVNIRKDPAYFDRSYLTDKAYSKNP
jgi:hypothetical protein